MSFSVYICALAVADTVSLLLGKLFKVFKWVCRVLSFLLKVTMGRVKLLVHSNIFYGFYRDLASSCDGTTVFLLP